MSKPSLFKQKIKQIKQQNQYNPQLSFPKAPKIDTTITQCKKQSLKQSMQNIVSKQQLDEIHRENQKMLTEMSAQDIQKYQKMIYDQLPIQFINELKANKQQQQQHQSKLPKKQTKIEENAAIIEQIRQNLEHIFLDIKTGRCYLQNKLEDQSDSIINLQQLKNMIESQNNQTQIIASSMLNRFITQNLNINTYDDMLLKTNGVLHKRMLIEDISYTILRSLLYQMKRTNFASCFTHFVIDIKNIMKIIGKWIPQSFKVQFKQLLMIAAKKQFQQSNKKVVIHEIIELLGQQQPNLSISFNNYQYYAELVIIEYTSSSTRKYNFPTFFQTLNKLEKPLDQVLKFMFKLICSIKIYMNASQNLYIKNVQNGVYKDCYILLEFALKQCLERNILVIQCLHILKLCNHQKFILYTEEFNNKDGFGNQQLLALFTYLNINQYVDTQCSKTQLNNLRIMIQYAAKVLPQHFPVQLLFIDMLQIFLNPTSPYNQLILQLQQFFKTITQKLINSSQSQLKRLIPLQKLKQLIIKYNYSSFGNASFTKLLFYFALNVEDYEQIIIQQVMSRYPYLFYFVIEDYGMYISTKKANKNNQIAKNEKKQIKELLQKQQKLNKNNIFYKYVS